MLDDLKIYTLLLHTIYFILLIGIAWFAYKHEKKSHADFIIGSRNIGVLGTLSSLAAGQFSGAVIFVFFSMAPLIGYGLMWMPFGATVGLLLLSLHLKSIHTTAKKHDYITLTDLIQKRVGQYTGFLATFIICFKALLLVASQLFIAGNIFAAIFDIPSFLSIFFIAFCIILYLWLGGYLTVIRTDILQLLLLFVSIVVPIFLLGLPKNNYVFPEIADMNEKSIGLFVFIALMVYSNAEMWQRMFSIQTYKSGLTGFITAGPILMILVFCTTTFALNAYNMIDINGMHATTFFDIFYQGALSPALLALLCVFLTSAIMSTIDTQVYLFTSTVTKNILHFDDKKEHASFVRVSRLITIVMLLILSIIAVTIGDILEFIFKAVSISFVLIPTLLLGTTSLIKKRVYFDQKMALAILIGLIVYFYMFFNGNFSNPLYTVIPPLISFAVFISIYIVPIKTQNKKIH